MYRDGFGRTIVTETSDARGGVSRITYGYDPATGLALSKRGPEAVPGNGQAVPSLVIDRDPMGRPVKIDDSGAVTTLSYDAYVRTIIDPGHHTSVEMLGAHGLRRIERFDDNRKPVTTSFDYGPFGQLRTVTQTERGGGASQATTYDYNSLGRLAETTDEAKTTTHYEYTAFGDVWQVRETDASTRTTLTTESTFDPLGRVLTYADTLNRTFANTYTYDPPNGTGQMYTATSQDGVATAYRYDGLGRLASETTAYLGDTYTFEHTYDGYGRSERLDYPATPYGSVDASFVYQPTTGLPAGLRSNAVGNVWEVLDLDAASRFTKVSLGNRLVENRSYDTHGRLLHASTDAGRPIRDLAYVYYLNGNLRVRADRIAGVHEQFTHDFLDRLESVSYFENDRFNYTDVSSYDDFGNMLDRTRDTERLAYSYNTGAAPHGNNAVTELHSAQRDMFYAYDERGNQVSASGTELVNGVPVAAPSRQIEYTDRAARSRHRLLMRPSVRDSNGCRRELGGPSSRSCSRRRAKHARMHSSTPRRTHRTSPSSDSSS